MFCGCACDCRASDQSPLTIVSSSSPEPTLEADGGCDDITDYKTWVKFLPDLETQSKERLSPEIPVVCPTPVKGAFLPTARWFIEHSVSLHYY